MSLAFCLIYGADIRLLEIQPLVDNDNDYG